MDYRDILNSLSYALKTAEGRDLVANALCQATVTCDVASASRRPERSPHGIELRVHEVYSSTTWDGDPRARKLLFNFDPTSRGALPGHAHTNSKHGGRQEWLAYPNEAVLVSFGFRFSTSLHQAFTPSVEIATKFRSIYYANDAGIPDQAAALLVNTSDDIVNLHQGQLVGHVKFHCVVTNPQLEYSETDH